MESKFLLFASFFSLVFNHPHRNDNNVKTWLYWNTRKQEAMAMMEEEEDS